MRKQELLSLLWLGFCCLSRERWGWGCGREVVPDAHHGGLGWLGLGV